MKIWEIYFQVEEKTRKKSPLLNYINLYIEVISDLQYNLI